MEFITNFIKRPISLVLPDGGTITTDPKAATTTTTTGSNQSKTAESDAIGEISKIVTIPTAIQALATLTTANCNETHSTTSSTLNHQLDASIITTTSTSDLEASLAEHGYGTGGDAMLQPSAATVTVAAADVSKYFTNFYLGNSLSHACLDFFQFEKNFPDTNKSSTEHFSKRTKNFSHEYSPLNNKSAGAVNKTLTPTTPTTTPTTTATTPIISGLLNKTPSNTNTQSREATPTTAAGTANSEERHSVHNVQAEAGDSSVLHVDLFGNSMPKRLSTKFIDLKEFDESELPDIPDELDPDFIEDPLKLSFNEGLPRKLSADSTATFDVEKFREATSTAEAGNYLNVNEGDAALSSDNETYAECESYRDSELNYEYPLETSCAEQYQSALNTHENTLNCEEMNTTFETSILNEDHLLVINMQPNMMTAAVFDEPEPMDVDANSTLEMSNHSSSLNNTTVEGDYKLNEQQPQPTSNRTTPEPAELKEAISKEDKSAEKAKGKTAEQHSEPQFEVFEQRIDATQVETTNAMQNQRNEEYDSKTVVQIPAFVTDYNKSASQTTAPIVTVMTSLARQSTSPLKIDISSTPAKEVAENLAQSPSFPLKPQNDTKKFPASPPAQPKNRQTMFLEPSMPIKSPQTPQDAPTATATNLSAASITPVELNTITTRSLSPVNGELNGTFNFNANISPAPPAAVDATLPCVENLHDVEKDKRRTFNVASLATPNKGNQAKNNENANNTNNETQANTNDRNHSKDERRTFDVISSTVLKPFPTASDEAKDEAAKRRTFNIEAPSFDYVCKIETPKILQSEEAAAVEAEKIDVSDVDEANDSAQNSASTTTVSSLTSLVREQLKQLNESVEAMDVDVSFTATPTSVNATLPQKSPPLPAQRERLPQKQLQFPMSPLKGGSSTLSIALNPNANLCTSAAAKILSKSPPLFPQMPAFDAQDMLMMPPPLRKTSLDNKKRSLFTESQSSTSTEALSEKEQTKSASKDEKDILIEKNTPSAVAAALLPPTANPFSNDPAEFFANQQFQSEFSDEDFNQKIVLQPSDFDYLLTKGSPNEPVDRSSLLLRFDPLIGAPVLANNAEKQQENLQKLLQKVTGGANSAAASNSNNNSNNSTRLGNGNEKSCLKSQTIKEEQSQVQGGDSSHNDLSLPVVASTTTLCAKAKGSQIIEQPKQQENKQTKVATAKRHANMSVDVIKDINNIDNDCTKNNYELSNSQSDEKQANYKMDELEKKIKNEVLKTEDIEKKLKEAEQREEALIKRITEKDKQILKMSNVTESYEKSIAELIAEKEQLVQNYEKQLTEISADRDSNYRHLMSLETTFSDLHVKYEKSKEMTAQLKANEEALLAEKRQNLENLHKQEQRYEKMKYHAMQQLDIANKKLEAMKKEYAVETTKLKAQLKKEEISRASLNEQLQQKTRENQELVKICDELISGQGS